MPEEHEDFKTSFPRIVLWYATERCDVGCKHCCYPPRNTKELSSDEAKTLMSKLSKAGARYFVFVGGEPLLRDDIVELCEFCNKVGLKPYVVTKGGKLVGHAERSDELAKELRHVGAKVTVAVDGITHSTIDAICEAPEVYERVMEALNRCLNHGILQGFVTAALKPNMKEIPLVLDLASNLGVERVVVFGIRPTGRAKSTFNVFAPTPKEFEGFMKEVAQGIRSRRWRQSVFIYDPLFTRFVEDVPWYERTRVCKIGHYFNIDSSGNVMACLFTPLRFGNALDEPLSEIYLKMVRETNKLRDPESLKGKCGICRYKYVCGGCRVRAFELTGDWHASDPLCSYDPYENEVDQYSDPVHRVVWRDLRERL
jgi:radical SAM protein with 4Fe4S-binding SPASM domain